MSPIWLCLENGLSNCILYYNYIDATKYILFYRNIITIVCNDNNHITILQFIFNIGVSDSEQNIFPPNSWYIWKSDKYKTQIYGLTKPYMIDILVGITQTFRVKIWILTIISLNSE